MDKEKVGEMIKKLRKKHHMTQKEFADKYCVTSQAVSKWEKGINLPDIALLKQMSEDYGVTFEDILEGKMIRKGTRKNAILLVLLATMAILLILFLLGKFGDSFKFKTLSSGCSEFKVSGSIAYDENKSSLNISSVNYCSGDDQTIYDSIECRLFEKTETTNKMISKCKTSEDKMKLEEYLDEVEMYVDNYKQTCREYNDNSLYLEISAYKGNTITTYKVPLSLNDNCSK